MTKIDQLDAINVEITVDQFNKLWINVDGVCALRIGRADRIIIELPKRKPIEVTSK